jgi:hypothetical protein
LLAAAADPIIAPTASHDNAGSERAAINRALAGMTDAAT